ncbi:DUF3993 domain-containing protein [Bacillus swezeyi]|uniref:DUF3993 domain-containing protein n=1 Tax=Bacillus swezeyi TaxID=1925020 RepID=UPI0039C5E97D
MKNVWFSLVSMLLAATAFFHHSDAAQASEKPTRGSLFETLESISAVHERLTEKERTKKEMISLLEPYMEHDFAARYVDANAFKEEKGWIFYGTDAPELAIPFFSYDEKTKVAEADGHYTVYECIGHQNGGPVSYDNDYLTVTIKNREGSLKVTNIGQTDTRPSGNEILPEKAAEEKQNPEFFERGRSEKEPVFPLFVIDFNWSLAGFLQ